MQCYLDSFFKLSCQMSMGSAKTSMTTHSHNYKQRQSLVPTT